MGQGEGKPVSVPYRVLWGEYDSFSSVTLKVSFSTSGCYRHAGPDSSKPLPQGKKIEKGKKITLQSSTMNAFGS